MIEPMLQPDEKIVSMKRFRRTIAVFSIGLLLPSLSWAQEATIRLDFSAPTAEENGVTITGANCGAITLYTCLLT